MNKKIEIFENPSFGKVRITQDEKGEPWFCLKDVCESLQLDAKQVVRRLDDEVFSKHPISDTLGRMQQTTFVNEDGLYDTILDSRKPEAKAFRKWITAEVLPQIRRTGGYIPIKESMSDLEIMSRALLICQNTIKEKEAIIASQLPAVAFAEAVDVSENCIGVSELAKLLQQNGIEIGQKRLFQWLRQNGYLGHKGEFRNRPMQRFMEQGLFEVREYVYSDSQGIMHTSITPKVTGKGQTYFINLFINNFTNDLQ